MTASAEKLYWLDYKGLKYVLKPHEIFTIGRSLQHSLVTEDVAASRNHCHLILKDGLWNLVDKSSNGTLVNDVRVECNTAIPLTHGDVVNISPNTYFKFIDSQLNENCNQHCDDNTNAVEDDSKNSHTPDISKVAREEVIADNSDVEMETVADVQVTTADKVDKEAVAGSKAVVGRKAVAHSKVVADSKAITKQMENELLCSICTEMFVKARTLSCAHSFCGSCITQWRKKNTMCPICRTPITVMNPTLALDNLVEAVIKGSSKEIQSERAKLLSDRAEMETVKSARGKYTKRTGSRRTRSRRNARRSRTRTHSLSDLEPELIAISSDEDELHNHVISTDHMLIFVNHQFRVNVRENHPEGQNGNVSRYTCG